MILSTYFCTIEAGEPKLTEHAEIRWVTPAEMNSLEWAPADIPAVNIIVEKLSA